MIEPTSAQLSELIGSIYDRAIDPEGWTETLARMRAALGADNAALSLVDLHSERFLLNFFDRVPDHIVEQFGRWESQAVKLWGGADAILAMPIDEPAILSRVNPAAREGANSYRDAFVAEGFVDAMTLGLARDERVIGSCVFGRVRRAGRFREEEIALARLLLPHAQRAIAFSRMFELATWRANAFEAALEAAAVPTILVSRKLEIIHANAAGEEALDRADAVRKEGKRLAVDGAHAGRLAQAVATASERPEAHPEQLEVDLDGPERQLKLLPLPSHTLRGGIATSATAAVVLTGPRVRHRRDEIGRTAILIERHGLTRAEAAVALEVAKGDGRSAAATRLGISENTVRTHLSSIFLKLGINRQAQLARLVDEAS